MRPRQPRSTLFPYTTLFRSGIASAELGPRTTLSAWTQRAVDRIAGEFLCHKPARGTRRVNGEPATVLRSEEHTSKLQSPDHLVCRLLLEKKKKKRNPLDNKP